MKKIILATLLSFAAASSFAASLNLQVQKAEGVNGGADNMSYVLTVRENINKNFSGDVQAVTVVRDSTGGLSNQRLELGLTGATQFVPGLPVSFYTRLGVGQKFVSTENFGYYSVEPGFTAPIGSSGLSVRVGWRYRNSFDVADNDETRTWRFGVNYAITKKDSVGIRYDSVRGDVNNNTVAVGYTRSF